MSLRIVYLVLVELPGGVVDIDLAYDRKGIAEARRLELNAKGTPARVAPVTLMEGL